MEALLILGIPIGLVVLFFWVRSGYRQGYNEYMQTHKAKQVAKGSKPWGEPWGETYGSAYYMTPQQIIDAGIGMSPEDYIHRVRSAEVSFLTLGETIYRKKNAITVMMQPGHIITIAPTRSGKGVSAVIPNLLLYGGSVVVNDIKGENHAITARRRRMMGQKVIKFAPFDEDSDCWNPFDSIGEDEDAWEDARVLAGLLITSPVDAEAFWDNEARNLLGGVILYVHTGKSPELRTLSHVRHILTLEREEFDLFLAQMATSKHVLAQRAATSFLGADDKVRAGVLSTLNAHMSIWDSPRLERIMGKSDFDFAKIKQQPTSIFFSLPPERLTTYAPVVRLFMGMAINAMSRNKAKPDIPVLFMLDEFPALGRVKAIEDGISYLAGYGIKLWIFAQDLKQIATIYGGKAQSIIANCAVKQFFGVSDFETAKLVSHLCGETTVPSISYSSETGLTLKNSNMNVSDGGRPLMTPDEVMSRKENLQFLFFQNQQPITGRKANYLANAEFFSNENGPVFDPNPFHS